MKKPVKTIRALEEDGDAYYITILTAIMDAVNEAFRRRFTVLPPGRTPSCEEKLSSVLGASQIPWLLLRKDRKGCDYVALTIVFLEELRRWNVLDLTLKSVAQVLGWEYKKLPLRAGGRRRNLRVAMAPYKMLRDQLKELEKPDQTKKEEVKPMKKTIKRRIRRDKDFQAFIERNAEYILRVLSTGDFIRIHTGNPNKPVDIHTHTDYAIPFRIKIRTGTKGREWETIQNPLTILHHTLQDQEGWEETIEKIFLAKDSEKARKILQEYLQGLDKEVKEKLIEDVRRKLEEKILDLI